VGKSEHKRRRNPQLCMFYNKLELYQCFKGVLDFIAIVHHSGFIPPVILENVRLSINCKTYLFQNFGKESQEISSDWQKKKYMQVRMLFIIYNNISAIRTQTFKFE
jgi:hypothetical protein